MGWWREVVEVIGLGRVHLDVNTDSMNLIDLSCGEWGSVERLFVGSIWFAIFLIIACEFLVT